MKGPTLEDIDFLAGDVGFSASNSWTSKVIRFFQNLHTKKADKSHSFACLGDGLIVESLNRIKINEKTKYDNPSQTHVSVYRLPLTQQDRMRFRKGMMLKASEGYGWTKLPMFALDGVLTSVSRIFGRRKPVFFFTRHAKLFHIPVCSQLVVYGLIKFTDYRLKDQDGAEVPWRIVSPDYLEDLMKLKVNGAHKVYERKP